jgi:hypothetical protein
MKERIELFLTLVLAGVMLTISSVSAFNILKRMSDGSGSDWLMATLFIVLFSGLGTVIISRAEGK